MTDTKKKTSRFAGGVALYALILMALILAGLVFFYFYIATYEYTRPENSIARYVEDLQDGAAQEQIAAFVQTLDHRVQPEAESIRLLDEIVRNIHSAKKVSECTDTRLVYVLKTDDAVLGEVVLTPTERQRLGFTTWEVSGEELDFEPLCQETERTVPAKYQVLCNGFPLDENDIVDDQVHYEMLEEFYDSYRLPCMVTYRSGKTIGPVDVEILDASGNPVSESDLTEAFFSDNCSEAEKAAISEFVNDYVDRYVTYLSGANDMHTYNLYAVLALTVRDSDLYSRLYQALGGQGFSSSHGDFIRSITLNRCMKLGKNTFACDVTYLVDTYGQRDHYTTTTNNAKLLLKSTDDGLRAYAQASY